VSRTHPPENRAKVKALKSEGKSIAEIMEATGLKKPTVYAYLRPVDAKPKAKAKTNGKAKLGVSVDTPQTLSVTPTPNGHFMVRVPADRLSAVAKALA